MVALVLCGNSVAVDSYYIYSVLEVDFCELKHNTSSPIIVLSTAIRIMVFEKQTKLWLSFI